MSHIKNAEAFGKLIGVCTGYAGGYNPGSTNLQITSMNAMLNEARQALAEVYSAQTLFDNATNDREVAFKEMRLRCTRIYSVLKACGAHPLTLEDARFRIRKMYGSRFAESIQQAADGTKPPVSKKRSPSGQDYISMTEHFAKLIETVSAEARYKPNETELMVSVLSQQLSSLKNLNEVVWQATVQLVNARNKRNAVMYRGDSNLYATAMAVKAYIKGAFGLASVQYHDVVKIRFTKYTN
jgi:hypothetical protein